MKELKYEQKIRLHFNWHSLNQSRSSLKDAISSFNDQLIYKAIGELLLWVTVSDDWHKEHGLKDYKQRKASDEGGKIIFGMRHAFNCFKHNMDFFQIHLKEGGFSSPFEFPIEIEETRITWIKAGTLLEGEFPEQKENYEQYLEGKEVLETFDKAIKFLNKENAKLRFS